MPRRAPRPCPRCRRLTPPATPCPCGHRPAGGNHTATRQQRGLGADWQKLRPLVLERDRHRCQLQLDGCHGIATTVDHLVPRARGGTNHPANLVAACTHCNSRKGAATPTGPKNL